MLRAHLTQNWFSLSDPAMEEVGLAHAVGHLKASRCRKVRLARSPVLAACEGNCMATRRRFALLIGAGALAPYLSFAQQQTKVWRVGFLSLDTSRSDAGQLTLKKFPAALAKLGYGEGRNLAIEWRWADGRTGDLRELAAGLVRAGVDVIVARTNGPIRAAKDATRSIPIVMFNGNFPVETGLVESLASPGGNVTGTAYVSPETIAKQMQLLKEIVPRARRVAILKVGNWATSSTSLTGQVLRIAIPPAVLARADRVIR